MSGKNGWFKESYRHRLAARGISTRRYNASKVGVGNAARSGYGVLDGAFRLGEDKFSLENSFKKGADLTPQVGMAGEQLLPNSYEKGKNWTPDVKMLADDTQQSSLESGSNTQEEAYHYFQANKKRDHNPAEEFEAPYEHVPKVRTPGQVYDFEEKTGRRHSGESLKHYLKREVTDEVDEDKEPDLFSAKHTTTFYSPKSELNIDARDVKIGESRRIPIREVSPRTYDAKKEIGLWRPVKDLLGKPVLKKKNGAESFLVGNSSTGKLKWSKSKELKKNPKVVYVDEKTGKKIAEKYSNGSGELFVSEKKLRALEKSDRIVRK